jgi:hypothetical protein
MRPVAPSLAAPLAWLLAFGLLFPAGVRSGEDPADADVEPFPLILRTVDRPDVLATTVVDARTGRPIEGAVVRGYAESFDGRAAAVNALLLTMTTDESGLAVADFDTKALGASHWIVSADGYRPYAAYHGYWPPERVDLEPSTPVAVRVVDPYGDAAADASVEGYSGCPHAPPAVWGRTDASGLFRAADGSPEGFSLWVLAAGCATTEGDLPPVFGDEPVLEVLSPGIAVGGRVRDAEGRPIAGAVLRGEDYPRGPAALTDLEGRFVLAGLGTDEGVQVFHPTLHLDAPHTVARAAADVPLELVWTLEGLGEEAPLGTLVVRARDPAGRVVEALDLLVLGEDGQGQDDSTDGDGEAVLDLPAGRYRIRGDDPFDPFDVGEATVVVPPGGEVTLDLALSPRPILRIEGEVPADLDVVVVAAGREHAPSEASGEEAPAPIRLPAEARAAVVLRNVEQGWAHFVAVGPVVDGVRTAALDVPPAHRIRLADDGALDGVHGVLAPRAAPRAGRLVEIVGGVLAVRWGGRFDLTLDLEDGSPARLVPLDLPPLAEGAVERRIELERDARPVADDGVATLLVRRADGLPLPPLEVSGGAVGAAWSGFSGEGWSSPVEVYAPSRVLLEAQGLHPLQLDVKRTGEHAVVFPAAGLDLTTVDASGAPVASAVLVNGVLFEAPEGRLAIAGFPAGEHAVVVQRTTAVPTVTGSVRWRFSLAEGERRAKTLRLP